MESKQANKIIKVYQYEMTPERQERIKEYKRNFFQKHKQELMEKKKEKYHRRKAEADQYLAAGDKEMAYKIFYGTALYGYKKKTTEEKIATKLFKELPGFVV